MVEAFRFQVNQHVPARSSAQEGFGLRVLFAKQIQIRGTCAVCRVP